MEILVFLIGLAGGILGGYALHKWIWHLPRRRAKLPSDATNTDILSHEIRTPLALISGAAELLEDTSLDERQRRLLHTVTTNSAHAIRLAETFLTGAKIRGSGLRLDKEDVDLRELVRQAASQVREILAVDILLTDPGAPLYVYGDRQLLSQVIWNLINNAARHCREGVKIVVRSFQDGAQVILEVTDNGSGISKSQRRDLFTYYGGQTSQAATANSGAGLGLGVVSQIVRGHGGEVLVDTLEGRGTTFVVSLPKGETK